MDGFATGLSTCVTRDGQTVTTARVPFALGVSLSGASVLNPSGSLAVTATGATTARDLAVRFADVVNGKDFGAVGDGVTDDTTAIQAALTAATGKTMFLPSGTYLVSAPLDIPAATRLQGSGWNTTIKLANGSNCRVIAVNVAGAAVRGGEICDLMVDGNKANQTGTSEGIFIERPYRFNLRRVRVFDAIGDGIEMSAVTGGSSFENYLEGCWAYNCGGFALRMNGSGITDTHVKGGDWGFCAGGGMVLATSSSISDATIWGGGIDARGVVTAGSSWQIRNCNIEGWGRQGVWVSAGNSHGLVHGNKIYANSFTSANDELYDGIFVDGTGGSPTKGVVITGNTVYSALSGSFNHRYALSFTSSHSDCVVLGNSFRFSDIAAIPSASDFVSGLVASDVTDLYTWHPHLLKFSAQSGGTGVNGITVTDANTGSAPSVSASGSDTNVGLTLASKGTGTVTLTASNIAVGSSVSPGYTPGGTLVTVAGSLGAAELLATVADSASYTVGDFSFSAASNTSATDKRVCMIRGLASGATANHRGGVLKFYAKADNNFLVERMSIDAVGNIVSGTAALSTAATGGFVYLPTCPGIPSGVPTSYTGRAPMIVDTTNSKLYVNVGGTWKSTTLA